MTTIITLPERSFTADVAAAIKLVEHTTKLRREVEPLQGPGRDALDEDPAELRTLSMRVANRLCAWGGQ